MANAKKCDRCGRFYEDFDRLYSLVHEPKQDARGMVRTFGRVLDLCPICDIALDRFMKLQPTDIVEAGGLAYSVDCGAKLGCVKKE